MECGESDKAVRLRRASPRWRCNLAIAAQLGLAVIVMAAVGFARQAVRERDIAAEWEMHTVQVLDETAQLRVATVDAMRGERGYLLVRDPAFLDPYREGVEAVTSGIGRLEQMTASDPRQQERLAHIQGRLDYHMGIIGTMIALADAGRRDEAIERIARGEGGNAVDLILAELDEFEQVERRLLAQRKAEREKMASAAELFETLLGIAGIALLGVGVWSAIALRHAIEREEAIRGELERCAMTDELTGLANRRETLATLARMMAGDRRHGRPLSLAILDIDHFKRVNDTFGHPAGDEVIRRVGEIATQVMREQDLVGRLGGEEFVVILPDTDAARALTACDRLRAAIAGTAMVIETGQALSITLSAGIAQMEPGDDLVRLIARADEALYAAKTAGRDRVLLAA